MWSSAWRLLIRRVRLLLPSLLCIVGLATSAGNSAAAPSSGSAQADAAIAAADFPISGEDKFLGNANLFTDPLFTQFFNQVTPENAGKWGSAAGLTRTAPMRWGNLDATYDFAEDNGFPFNFHVLVWGNQQPTWMESLSSEEQLAEIDQWFAAVAERYPGIDWIQVVNEPLHDPPDCEHPMNQGASCPSSGDYLQALGGHNGTDGTGWDWVLNAFRLARQHFGPDAKLMINDYSITNSNFATTQYLEIIELLEDEDLIDAIGVQGHAFSTGGDMATHAGNLDRLAATGLPIQVTELDIDGLAAGGLPGDEVQLADYRRIFPTFWEHPAVEGITLWGWRQPNHWRNGQDAPIVLSTGELKPAAHWLLAYVNAIAPVITPGQAFTVDDGEIVGTVEAEDWASQIGRTELRTFTWEITGETGTEIFEIDSSTGQILVANPQLLDRNDSPYSLDVRVSDGFHASDDVEVTISFPNAPPAIDAIGVTPENGDAPLEVDFSVEASDEDGDDLSYEWDFDDGNSSSQQNPTHTYTDPGTYEAEVTVSDGEDSVSASVEVDVTEPAVDVTPPVTTHELVSDDPGAGGVYRAPVTVFLFASDPGPDGSGVAYTEYRVNGGPWTIYDPFAPPAFDDDGAYAIEYRSADSAGNLEEIRPTEFALETGVPEADLTALPALRRVGPKRRQVTYRARVRNAGVAATGPLEVCAIVPAARLRVVGPACREIDDIEPGARAIEAFQLRVRPAARGKLTRVRFAARGSEITNLREAARLRVRR